MIRLSGYTVPYAIKCVEEGQKEMPFLSESELFATPYGRVQFPANIEKIRGSLFGGSKRLEMFLGQ